MTDAIVPNLIIYKSCRTDFGWNETVCDDYNLIYDYPEQNDIVNDEVILKYYLLKSYSENCARVRGNALFRQNIFSMLCQNLFCSDITF